MSAAKKVKNVKKRKSVDEKALESLVFGNIPDVDAPVSKKAKEMIRDEEVEVDEEDKPAWVDEHDETLNVKIDEVDRLRKLRQTEEESEINGKEYEARLRSRFQQSNGGSSASWATKKNISTDDIDLEEAENAILRRSGSLVGKGDELPSENLDIKRVKDLNLNEPCKAVVQCIEWHPRGEIALTASFDRKCRIFAVDGKVNPKVQSVFIKDLPIHNAKFKGDGAEIILTGRRKFWYVYDVVGGNISKISSINTRNEKSWESFSISPDGKYISFLGNDGYIVLVSGTTKQWISNLKINGSVRAVSFTPCSKELYAVGGDGDVYRWDLRSSKCLHRHVDEGNLCGTSLSVSHNGLLYAVGSDSGVVNIYNEKSASTSPAPTPIKSIMNLTTPVNDLRFNSDDSILAMYSHSTKESLRLVHVNSRTVFKNWPTSHTPLHYVSSISFSPNSGYMSIGNDKGSAMLYRLNHFPKA